MNIEDLTASEVAQAIASRRADIVRLQASSAPLDHYCVALAQLEREIVDLSNMAARKIAEVYIRDFHPGDQERIEDWTRASYGMEVSP